MKRAIWATGVMAMLAAIAIGASAVTQHIREKETLRARAERYGAGMLKERTTFKPEIFQFPAAENNR